MRAVCSPSQRRRAKPGRLRVTVLRGGPGAERRVSLESGAAVAEALRRRGHEVYEADIGPGKLSALERAADVVFPALHGTFGEDGTLQGIMERRGIRFVGSGSGASALAMDKLAAKRRALELGIPTPAFRLLRREQRPPARAPLALPVVVKPVGAGSSVRVSIVRQAAEWRPAVRAVLARYGRALVEEFIAGDELTVGIVGQRALPPICVRPRREFYDYQAKYHDQRTEYLFDAGHPPTLLQRARALSLRLFCGMGCRHLARVDWMADRAGRLWFLELNTIPGFTSHSLVPKAAARAGIPFDRLVERLVYLAAEESQ